MAEYEKIVRKILDENGCYFVRHAKGDHDLWHSPINNRPRYSRWENKITAHGKRNIKQAGIKEKIR